MKKLTQFSIGTVLATLLATPAFAQATTAQDDATNVYADIVVTARRTEERLQDVPITITVLNQEQLAAGNITNGGELANLTPSLSTNARFGPEKTSFAIRGFVQESSTLPSVGVYFADAGAPRATHFTGGGNGAGPGSMFDLQSIQVLTGPQGTLFGRNTTGGAILLTPNRPGYEFGGNIQVSTGNYDMERYEAVLNLPLSDTFRMRFGMDRQYRDGYLTNLNSAGPDNFADVDYEAYRVSAVMDLAPNLENYLVATYSNSSTTGNNPIIVACNPGTVAFPTARNAACAQIAARNASGDYYTAFSDNPDQHQDMTTWQLINTTTWDVTDNLTIKNILSYGEYVENFNLNTFGLAFMDFFTVHGHPGLNAIDQNTLTEELQFQGNLNDGQLEWQAGLFIERSDPLALNGTHTQQGLAYCDDVATYQCPTGSGGRPLIFNDTFFRTWFESTAVYAQATYKVFDQLSLTAGLRYSEDEVRGEGMVSATTVNPANTPTFRCSTLPGLPTTTTFQSFLSTCFAEASTESNQYTWTTSAEYHVTDDSMLYLKYSRGYRPGGVDLRLPSEVAGWDPESVDSYELGAKVSFDGPIPGIFNIAYFYNDFTDQQLQVNLTYADGRRASSIVNAGQSTIQGIELQASVQPIEDLTLSLGYTYLDTELVAYSRPDRIQGLVTAGTIVSVSGEPTPGGSLFLAPQNKFVFSANYVLPLPESIGEISINGSYTYTAEQQATNGDAAFVSAIGFDPGSLPETNLINLGLNWEHVARSAFDLSFFATNVTEEEYPVNTGATYGQIGFSTQVVGPPRMYGARLRYRFGAE